MFESEEEFRLFSEKLEKGKYPREKLQKANRHLYKYWNLSKGFFLKEDSALATFFAITLMEELGKLAILNQENISGVFDKKSFFDHEKKYRIAVYNTLFVNSRVSRIYGQHEEAFANLFKTAGLLLVRNRSLYLSKKDDNIVTPAEDIDEKEAFILVCFAGEMYAEIQGFMAGTGPKAHSMIIKEIDELLDRFSHLIKE
jgi:AbiV family abortive infection protein